MDQNNGTPPDWAPKEGGDAFAVTIKKGVRASHDGLPEKNSKKKRQSRVVRRSELGVSDYVSGVLASDRTLLGRTITLIESNSAAHAKISREVLNQLLPHAGKSVRLGITGVPGAGKSTLIEALGLYLIDRGLKVAVLAVDPSSSVTRGSILGDKTRMERLSQSDHCFIRPSPSGGTLGGVTRKSRETILVCEAAGYDVILVETVGVGQSEITVRSMVDFFLLVMISGAGDELQGIKKGVIEIADALVVNKADGANKTRAKTACAEYATAMKYLTPATKGWKPRAMTCSALTGDGIADIWQMVGEFRDLTGKSGIFEQRRREQSLDWVFSMVEDHLRESFYQNPGVKAEIDRKRKDVLAGHVLPTAVAESLLKIYQKGS